jgi:serine/threonine-protein kinase RsbW
MDRKAAMQTTTDRGVVALSIPAKAEYIALCRLALTGLAQVRGFDPETLADLKLAITEACSNSIRHGYDGERAGVVDVRYELSPDELAVEVVDDGGGFDLAAADTASGVLDEGGLGIAIIRSLTDELAIESHERGSRLRFVKYLS